MKKLALSPADRRSTTTYEIAGRTFIVESVFKEKSEETIGTILLKLMKEDAQHTELGGGI